MVMLSVSGNKLRHISVHVYHVRSHVAMEAKRGDLLELLRSAHAILVAWEEGRRKIVAQLRSIKNLTVQLQALENCSSSSGNSGLGVLGSFPSTVISRLRAKIMQSMERAHDFVLRDKYADVCKIRKPYSI